MYALSCRGSAGAPNRAETISRHHSPLSNRWSVNVIIPNDGLLEECGKLRQEIQEHLDLINGQAIVEPVLSPEVIKIGVGHHVLKFSLGCR
jgi:hypothetical protein